MHAFGDPLTLLETNIHPTRLVFTHAHFVNFAIVPPQIRFVFVSAVSLVLRTSTPYLSGGASLI